MRAITLDVGVSSTCVFVYPNPIIWQIFIFINSEYFALSYVPKERMEKGAFDVVGALLTGLSVTGLILYSSTFSLYLLFATVLLLLRGGSTCNTSINRLFRQRF